MENVVGEINFVEFPLKKTLAEIVGDPIRVTDVWPGRNPFVVVFQLGPRSVMQEAPPAAETHGQRLPLRLALFNPGGHVLEHSVVEAAAQTSVRCVEKEQNVGRRLSGGQEWVVRRSDRGGKPRDHFPEARRVRLPVPLGILGPAQLARGDHFHGVGHFPRVLQAVELDVEFFDTRHAG